MPKPSQAPESIKRIIDGWYEEYFFILYKYALPKLGFDEEAAIDCVHKVFDAAQRKAVKLNKHPNPGGWMTDAVNKEIKKYYAGENMRLQRNRIFYYEHQRYDIDENFELWPDNSMSDDQIQHIMGTILDALSEDELNLYHLFYKQKERIKAISRVFMISEAAVKMRLLRLRNKITKQIEKIFLQ